MKLKGYEKIRVIQRDPQFGCIPTGIEWMIMYKGIKISNIEKFQEKFNLEAKGLISNNFQNITEVVIKEYPQLRFKLMVFPQGRGDEKLKKVNETVKRGNPCLFSLYQKPFKQLGRRNSYHIMPVVEIDEEIVNMLNGNIILQFKRKDLTEVHNNFPGGNDILILQ